MSRSAEAVHRAKTNWRLRNPEYKKRWRAANPQAERDSNNAKKHGMPLWMWRALRSVMPEGCEICGQTLKLLYDHCHTQGHFRGWLCDRCNTGLGKFSDDPIRLRAAADYLERNVR